MIFLYAGGMVDEYYSTDKWSITGYWIGWTMDAPASGHWMLTNAFYGFVGREKIEAITKS